MGLKEALARVDALEAQVKDLQQLNTLLYAKLYGSKSEQLRRGDDSSQPWLFPDGGDASQEGVDQGSTEIAAHTRRRKRLHRQEEDAPAGSFPAHLPREERIVAELPEGVSSHEECECIGEEVTERLAQTPSALYVIRTVRKKYKVKATGKICCAPAPAHLFDRCMVDESFLVLMALAKVLWHLPLYRQVQMAALHGVTLDRGSMARWLIKMSELFAPVVEALKKELLQQPHLHCDETPSVVGKRGANGKKKYAEGRFWPILYESLGVVFVYTPTRSFKACRDEVLGNYSGTLITDAYAVYEKLAATTGATLQLCWMHVRRNFYEAQRSNPLRAQQALELIGKLYEIEKRVKECRTPQEKRKIRLREAAPLLDEFHRWAKKLASTPEALTDSLLFKALSYVLSRWESATWFITDPTIPLDNGAAERSIRPFKLGANNWLFCASEVGAEALVNLYSLVYSARMHGIDPYLYLRDLCDKINQPGLQAIELTPARWKKSFMEKARMRFEGTPVFAKISD